MSLRIWLPMTKDLSNQGLENISITNNGATLDTNGKLGNCYSFGTAASGLLLANTKMETFTSECSVSFWVNIVSWNVNYATIFQAGKGGRSWSDYVFGVLRNSSGSTLCFTITQGSTSSSTSFQTPSLNLNTWYHLTFIYKTGHCLVYVNGSLYKDSTTTMVPSFSSITKVSVGRANDDQYQSNCKLNDIRIYDHALSAKEVKELSKGLVVHYPLDNNGQGDDSTYTDTTVYDTSGYGYNGTKNGTLTYSSDTARYSVSTYVPKAGYIQHPNALGSDTMNQEWTCCAWVKLDSTSLNNQPLNSFNLGNNIVHAANGTPLLYLNMGTHDYYRYGSVKVSADTWTHIAFVFKNSDGTRNIYVNGELKNSYGPNVDNIPAGIPNTITVFGDNFAGYVSDYREYATMLSAEQVAELYNAAAHIDNHGNAYGYEFKEVE